MEFRTSRVLAGQAARELLDSVSSLTLGLALTLTLAFALALGLAFALFARVFARAFFFVGRVFLLKSASPLYGRRPQNEDTPARLTLSGD